ncbi:EF hand [Prochlorococcus marinus str. MIT 1313]|uniref:EF-hand domain-containing protein n=1 Tax=Prochlorococcus TaxID=1218 RepID=UPI0007BB79BE|nr:EF-hand domain-containing protein [Prochlorococcus marinus]KZR69371.1 EF hand [Prochlorococcus marinus str. MIT 1313]KZR71609.1 EF hand [Prochlorococcus marinus str. MIT 1318]
MTNQPRPPLCWPKSLQSKVFRFITAGLISAGALLNQTAAEALPDGIEYYGQRMEAMFLRLDLNGDGRLDASEVGEKTYLIRRLNRNNSRGYLVLEDLRPPGTHPNGKRLQRRFKQADIDGNGKLNRDEAQSIRWLANNFNKLDLNNDRDITMEELWMLQRSLAPHPYPRKH